MIIQTGKVAGGIADSVTKTGPLKIMDNPLFAALIITVIAMMVFFRLLGKDGRLDKVGWKMRIRVGVYVFILVGLVTAVHYYALNRELSEFYKTGASDELMSDIHGGLELSALGAYQPEYVAPQAMTHAPQQFATQFRPMAGEGAAAVPPPALQLAPVSTNLLPSAVV